MEWAGYVIMLSLQTTIEKLHSYSTSYLYSNPMFPITIY